jgi:hypothetical protein
MSMMLMNVRMGLFYSLNMVVCFMYFRKHHMQSPPESFNVPPEKGGTERSWGRCARTMGAAAPWASLLATALHWWAAGLAWMSPPLVFWSNCEVWMGFAFVLPKYVFWKAYFVVFRVCACKTYKYQNSWRMLVINPIPKFWWSYFLCFVEMLVA